MHADKAASWIGSAELSEGIGAVLSLGSGAWYISSKPYNPAKTLVIYLPIYLSTRLSIYLENPYRYVALKKKPHSPLSMKSNVVYVSKQGLASVSSEPSRSRAAGNLGFRVKGEVYSVYGSGEVGRGARVQHIQV